MKINVEIEKLYQDSEIPEYKSDGRVEYDLKAYVKTSNNMPWSFL